MTYIKYGKEPILIDYDCQAVPREGEKVLLHVNIIDVDNVECRVEKVYHILRKTGARIVVVVKDERVLVGKTDLEDVLDSLRIN